MTVAVEAAGVGLPFQEAIDYFRQKVDVPTDRWDRLWEGMHARAFTVAGAMKEELLTDLRQAVGKALAQGTTIETFRKDFASIVERHGWVYNGGFNWRTRVIFDTNLRMAYAAGRWEQIQRQKENRPLLRYSAVMDGRTRPQHAEWHGTVLPVDHAWWKTHYPPNGWNCRCTVVSLSRRQAARFGFKESLDAPPSPTRPWTRPIDGKVLDVPEGIDAGFAYNVGQAATGTRLADDVMEQWRTIGAKAYRRLTDGDWMSAGRPRDIPAKPPQAALAPRVSTTEEARAIIEAAIGGAEAALTTPAGTVHVDTAALATHVDLRRSPFLPLLPELLQSPYEVWLAFEQHEGTGRVELRQRFVSLIQLATDRYFVVSAQAVRGRLEAWTIVPSERGGYIQNQRVGWLLYGA